jgi:hypothetical protein
MRAYDTEDVFVRQTGRQVLLLAMHARIDALVQYGARFVARKARLPQRDFRVEAQRNAFLSAEPVVAEMPGFSAMGGDVEREPVGIAKRVAVPEALACRTALSDNAMILSPELKSGLDSWLISTAFPARIRHPQQP